MPALVAGIHAFTAAQGPKTWMSGTSPAMTNNLFLLDHAHEMRHLASDVRGEQKGEATARVYGRFVRHVMMGMARCRSRGLKPKLQ